jgi:O-antigen/teichoic acid export membrane protein
MAVAGFDQTLVRFLPVYRSRNDRDGRQSLILTAWGFTTLASVILGAIVFLSSEYIGRSLFHSTEVGSSLGTFAVFLVPYTWVVMSTFSAQGQQRAIRSLLIQDVLFPVSSLISLAALVTWARPTYGPALAFGFGTLATGLVGVSFVRRDLLARSLPQLARIREWFSFGGQVMIIEFAAFAFTGVSSLAVGIFVGVREAGIYAASQSVVTQAAAVASGLAAVLPARMAALFSDEATTEVGHLLRATTRWLARITVPGLLALAALSTEALSVFGPEFRRGSAVLAILALGNVMTMVFLFSGYALVAAGRQRVDMVNHLVLAIVGFVAYPISARLGGVIGVALTTSMLSTSLTVVKVAQVRSLLGITMWDRELGVIFGIAGLSSVAYVLLRSVAAGAGAYGYLTLLACCALTYSVGVIATMGVEDRTALLHLVRRPAR